MAPNLNINLSEPKSKNQVFKEVVLPDMMKGQAMVGMRRSSSCRTEVTGTSADQFPPSTTWGLGSFLRVQLYTSIRVVKQQVEAEHSAVLIIMIFAKITFKILKFPVSWTNMSVFETGNSFS